MSKKSPTTKINTRLLKAARAQSGLGYGALSKVIAENEPNADVHVSKTELHRAETVVNKEMSEATINAIERALGASIGSLVMREASDLYRVKCLRTKTGSELATQAADTDIYNFHMIDEPGNHSAQKAILDLLKLLEKPLPHQLQYTNYYSQIFEYREILETLKSENLAIFTSVQKQVAPFIVHSTRGDYSDAVCEFHRINHGFRDDIGIYEGYGICDALLLCVGNIDNEYIDITHKLDNYEIVSERHGDDYLIENIARNSLGLEFVDYLEYKDFSEDDFVSERAQELWFEQKNRAENHMI